MFIEVTWTPPPGTCTGSPFPGVQLTILLDGEQVASTARMAGNPPGTDVAFSSYIFAPDDAEPHTLTAQVGDNCTGNENATVEDVKVDVASFLG